MQGKHINEQTSTHGLEQQSVKTSENQSNRSIKMVPKDLKQVTTSPEFLSNTKCTVGT